MLPLLSAAPVPPTRAGWWVEDGGGAGAEWQVPRREDLVVTRWGARFLGQRIPCSVGRAGIGQAKSEGDLLTPCGVYRLLWLYWRADRRLAPVTSLPARPLGPRQGWAETPEDPSYNRPIRHPHAYPADRMVRGDPLYDICVVTDQNAACIPYAGSAIFVHFWRKPRHPTAGCVAFQPRDLTRVLARWTSRSRLVIRG